MTGFLLGREAYLNVFSLHFASQGLQDGFLIISPIVGALIGLAVAPIAQAVFETELSSAEGAIDRLAPAEILGGALGLIVGLIVSFLVKSVLFESIAIAGKPGSYIAIALYIIVSIFTAYLGARVGAKNRLAPFVAPRGLNTGTSKVIDTSVIVDGRIVEIIESGFLEGPLIVPRFVLRELQAIADSADSLKRTRGRRGLEVLARLQERAVLEIGERDYDDLPPGSVDAKLVRLARELGAKLVTNDFNLNQVAHVEGVAVLNINELAGAVKPAVLPGEELHVSVIREGKEPQQGVGYLDDGTMIIVENGRRSVGSDVDVVVTSVLQTAAGRMIFARRRDGVR
ncbi:MAG: PIN domain-containing protein [Vulcanimicrobiaceae bacterium]